MTSPTTVLEVLRAAGHGADADLSLAGLARRSGWSASHLHRAFTRVTGETPKHYALRVRLTRAAARLAAGTESVLEVALETGFASHEVFTRAFGASTAAPRRHFAPGLWRRPHLPPSDRPTGPPWTPPRRACICSACP